MEGEVEGKEEENGETREKKRGRRKGVSDYIPLGELVNGGRRLLDEPRALGRRLFIVMLKVRAVREGIALELRHAARWDATTTHQQGEKSESK